MDPAQGVASVSDGDTIAHGLKASPTQFFVASVEPKRLVSVTDIGCTTCTISMHDEDGTAITVDEDIYWRAIIKNGIGN